MKLKKKIRRLLLVILIVLLCIFGYFVYKNFFGTEAVKEAKVIGKIKGWGYTLKDNKDEKYKKMFYELKDILEAKEVDYDAYASKISEMFIYDFYSLKDKVAKNDIGGVEFIHPDALANFLENAENTYYKYVESNIYGNRSQSLPKVKKVKVGEPESVEFTVGEETDDEAFDIDASWTYTTEEFSDYQDEANLKLVHVGKKLYIAELQSDEEEEE